MALGLWGGAREGCTAVTLRRKHAILAWRALLMESAPSNRLLKRTNASRRKARHRSASRASRATAPPLTSLNIPQKSLAPWPPKLT
jgi:hypothetical protein